ncbi:GerAB/ArcD/ProY family transporter [Paenibacillus arenilitoris]|uniref:GerAB/ArcD/ProY family transporter n=1 Tax=Paenibacillus arenilitoris TaxID=2772299 RepID=A0A927H8Y4_9BACL|nr:GerAB/ArcD/ProY family transporter [Paenibacillus arenilitoris]MBD2872057.1 GerAB/ArcD/ProY family transporter [Paenibacillus arenilitoris]
MKSTEPSRYTISPYLVFVLILTMQFGPEYITMSNKPIQLAGQDAWISVILCGISFHIVIWVMYRILDRNGTDLIHIHERFFGKWAGGALNLIFIAYFLLHACFQMRLFIEIIQVWLFPDLETWALALALLLLVYYIVAGGFRVIVGICMFSLLRYFALFTLIFTAEYFHFSNLSPVMDHSLHEIIKASKQFTFPYLGVETLLFCYTFIKTPKKSQKWTHLSNVVITVFYLMIVSVSLLLFKPEQLSTEMWEQLTKNKFVHFPFIERFEYIGAASQILWVIPVICFCLWASSRMVKLMFTVKQLTVLPILLMVVFAAVCLIQGRSRMDAIQTMLSEFGFYMIYGYIPFLYIVDVVRMKARRSI